MSRHDWYRNTSWDAEIETTFRAKLARARSSKPQYLVIQAGMIAKSHPEVALQLVEEFFLEFPEDSNAPSAHCVRGQAYTSRDEIGAALGAYKDALDWEAEHPGLISTARWDLPRLIVNRQIEQEYDLALEILASLFEASDHKLPKARYEWNGLCGLIAEAKGEVHEAREFAERALRAASATQSPFRFHRDVGLVEKTDDEFGRRIKRIARPNAARRIWQIFKGGRD